MLDCESCGSDELTLIDMLPDGRRRIGCVACGYEWVRGEPKVTSKAVSTFEEARKRFPGPENVEPRRLAQVAELKARFLRGHPDPQPAVAPYWARYQEVFSEKGLASGVAQDLKDFANSEIGARPGNMSVFNRAWNDLGAEVAANRTRATIQYLLYGPASRPLEDRLTDLIEERRGLGMTGFKESLLTKVLCVVEPDRFLPILTYSSPNLGKKEVAKLVYDLDLPDAARVQWTIGRLILWSNDVLLTLAGDGFAHMQHVSQFLWNTAKSAESQSI